ncbi:MAG: ATP-binding protein [Methanogenium sp.]|jgi:hypothetical protein
MSNIEQSEQKIASIQISPDYFQRCARNEYGNPIPWIWIREALQNSVDAGASVIDITVDENYVTLTDNGCGMSAETIYDKLLTLGGSFKNNANSTGGFGKAKEILFFAWAEWSIESSPNKRNRYYVDSNMIGRAPIIKTTGQYKRGTTIRIKIDSITPNRLGGVDNDIEWKFRIQSFVSTCTTRCRITLNGEVLQVLPDRGMKLEFDIATLRVNKSHPTNRIYIRINGITMFSRYMRTEIPALVTVDLKGNSIDLLSSSRESLVSGRQTQLDNIIANTLTNPKTVLIQASEGCVRIDKYLASQVKAAISQIANHLDPTLAKKAIELSNIADILPTPELTDAVSAFIEEIDDELAIQLQLIINNQYESKLGYTYVVKRYHNKAPDINPEGNKAQTIIHCWKRIIDAVVEENKLATNYLVGLTFNPDVNASVTTIDNTRYVLINPNKVPKYGDALSLGMYLFPKACHELAHFEYENHNEDFSCLMGKYIESLGNNPRKWIKLFSAVKLEAKQLNQ